MSNPKEDWITDFITVVWLGESVSGLTEHYRVESRSNGINLGNIKWYSRWRRYVFYPENDVILDSSCLIAISTFLDNATIDQKKKQ